LTPPERTPNDSPTPINRVRSALSTTHAPDDGARHDLSPIDAPQEAAIAVVGASQPSVNGRAHGPHVESAG
jgi:hypothetical protein